jgi:hypothetical protein
LFLFVFSASFCTHFWALFLNENRMLFVDES